MNDTEQLIQELKNALDGKYERATVKIIKDKSSTLYVDFNDTLNNTLALSMEGKCTVVNLRNLNDEYFKTRNEWMEERELPMSVEEAVNFFHSCYERMVRDEKASTEENKRLLQEARVSESTINLLLPDKLIGKPVRR